MCLWRCLAIFKRIQRKQNRPEKDTTREALSLARKFYQNSNLKTEEVKPTKLIDFEHISKTFNLNIRLYEPKNEKVWKLVFGKNQFRKGLDNLDIGLHNGHCFYIKKIDFLTNHWECRRGCQQRFSEQVKL